MDIETLTALFRKLGARNPEGWAGSQIREGIPQLTRFLILRKLWSYVVDETDTAWIDRWIASSEAGSQEPFAGVGHALRSLRARGATNEELTDLVRGMQAEMLSSFCYVLDDPYLEEPEVAHISWALVQTDEDGTVLATIQALHESVLDTDPTGREMRPRSAG